MNELTENSKKYFIIVEELHSTPLTSATMAIGKESANNSFSAYQRKLKALGIIAQNYQENSAVTSGKLVTGKAEIETNDETVIDNIALYIKDNIDSIFGSAKNEETKVASVAMETKTGNLGLHSTKIGFQALTKGENAVAIGTGAQANAKDTISIGTGNIVTRQGSIAIGDPTIITGSRTSSLGNDNGTIRFK